MSWIDVDVNDNYEMLNEFPYTVRNKRNHCELKLQPHRGYYRVQLQKKRYYIHKLAYECRLRDDIVYKNLVEANASDEAITAYKKTLLKAIREEFKIDASDDSQ